MANGEGLNGSLWKIMAAVGGGLCTIALAFAVTTAKNAQIALEVAAQHGEEIQMIRGELSSLRIEMASRTADRYTARDAERDDQLRIKDQVQFFQLIEARISALERELQKEIERHDDEHR
jgi:hypothetical protein